jgi:hypothetical protein
VYPQIAYWLLREGLWWWIVIQLLALIICFLRESLALRWVEAMAWLG